MPTLIRRLFAASLLELQPVQQFRLNRLSRALVTAIGLIATVAPSLATTAGAQLNYTQTDFLHGFGSSQKIWTTPYGDLGGVSTPDYLGSRIGGGGLGPVGLPFFDPRTRYANQLAVNADSVYYQNGRHVLVGHSLGALVARGTYLGLTGVPVSRAADVRAGITGIVAVAAPHQGLPLAYNAEEAKNFFTDVERRVNDALGAAKITAFVYGAVFKFFRPFSMLLVAYLGDKEVELDELKQLPAIPALRDLRDTSQAIRELNANTADAAIARANVIARHRLKNSAIRVAAATQNKDEDEQVRLVSRAKILFGACKYAGYATLVLSRQARQCSYGAKVLGRIDERWGRYTLGTEWGRDRWGRQVEVPRQIPFDGVVPNERSRYPGLDPSDANNLPPVEGANHQSIYRRRDGVERVLRAMQAIGMGQPQPAPERRPPPPPPPAPLSSSIDGPNYLDSGASGTWSAVVSGGTPPYRYQWSGRVSGTGASVTRSFATNGTIYLDVYDAAGAQTRSSMYVEVAGGCGGPIMC